MRAEVDRAVCVNRPVESAEGGDRYVVAGHTLGRLAAVMLTIGSAGVEGTPAEGDSLLCWKPICGEVTTRGNSSEGTILRWQFDYGQEPSVIACPAGAPWKGTRGVSFDVRSDREGSLFLRIDHLDKKVFLTHFSVSEEWRRVELAWSALTPFGDGATGSVDPALVEWAFLVDLNGSDGGASGRRTIEVRKWSFDGGVGVRSVPSDTSVAVDRARPGPRQLTYVDLVKQLIDLEALAVLPERGERCGLWSSYDRSSRVDVSSGAFVDWGGNEDGVGIIRREGDAAVLAEMAGPGCIRRIWSARPGPGHVKIYLDGADEPAIDLPFEAYFDRQHAPFDYPALVYYAAEGANLYVPISYQRSCKVVAEPGWGMFYQFTYQSFPEGTTVPTFDRRLSAEDHSALESVDGYLREHLGRDPAGLREGQETIRSHTTVLAGEQRTVASIEGARAITALRIRVDGEGLANAATLLRGVVLRIHWDGEREPAVWSPLGDFFGSAPGINEYRSLPSGMGRDGFYSFWYMPFARSAKISVENEGSAECSLSFEITHVPLSRPADELGRFHAKWHRDAFLPADPQRWMDWTILTTQGRGRYCGMMLHVWNPRGHWWGEGDEKFFVDGESSPSSFGTGSEDYFGYAWCSAALFAAAYHGQTHNDGDNRGHVSVYRWHIADNVPFGERFDGFLGKYHLNRSATLYACTVYWYLSADGTDPYVSVPLGQRSGYFIVPQVHSEPGVMEGEALSIVEVSGGTAKPQDMVNYDGVWSGDAQLWWSGGRPGDRLVLAVPLEDTRDYEISIRMTEAPDYGKFELYLDDRQVGDGVDLYAPEVRPGGVVLLGSRTLHAGRHRLAIVIVGAHQRAERSYMFGVDWIKLEAR